MWSTLLVMAAFLMACIATAGVELPRFKFGWAALAAFFLSLLLGGVRAFGK